jgi:hypothetical protein
MAITRVRKSSVRSSAKYNKAYAGAAGYAWLTGGQANSLLSGTFTAPPDPSSVACMRTADGQPQIIRHNGSPGGHNGSIDGGFVWGTYVPNIGYSSYPGAFNGAFLGGGNYITSSAGYTNDARNGWTFVTGLYNISASFGAGNGGFTSAGVPVFVIPYSYGGAHQIAYKVEAVGSTGISSATWTTAVTVHSVAGNGYQAKVAVTNNKLIYVGYSNTTPSTGTIFVRYADLNSATGVPGTFSTGTLSVTGLMTSLQTVNGTFVLTTADNKIYTSTDGATWTTVTSPYAGTSALHLSPPVDGKIMVYSVASQGSYPPLYVSSNGTTWTSQETLSMFPTSTLTLITGCPGLRSVMINGSGPGNVTYLNGNRLVS